MAGHKKGAQKLNATLVFWDESGFSLRPSIHRIWAPRGQTPILRQHFNWKRLNAVGAIACQPDGSLCQLLLHWQEETFKGPGLIRVLDKLHRQVAVPIILLWDSLPAHKSKVVQAYVQEQRDWLRLEWLPAYAPELNPPEYLWSSLKGKEMANVCPDTLGELSGILAKARQRMGCEPGLLQDFLKASSLFDASD